MINLDFSQWKKIEIPQDKNWQEYHLQTDRGLYKVWKSSGGFWTAVFVTAKTGARVREGAFSTKEQARDAIFALVELCEEKGRLPE
ncbi:MAG: hypothetical protein Q4G42_03530 [Neisseria sp.]|nr:hypothetical protein [Neisseria sp.]